MSDDHAEIEYIRGVVCPVCTIEMRPERGHYTCDRCRYTDSCCDGGPA